MFIGSFTVLFTALFIVLFTGLVTVLFTALFTALFTGSFTVLFTGLFEYDPGSFSGPGFKTYCFHPVAFPFPIMGDDQKSPVFSGKEIICNLLF